MLHRPSKGSCTWLSPDLTFATSTWTTSSSPCRRRRSIVAIWRSFSRGWICKALSSTLASAFLTGFLGHRIKVSGLAPHPTKVDAVCDYTESTTVNESAAKVLLQTDAFDIAIGTVLQQNIKGQHQPLSFFLGNEPPRSRGIAHTTESY